MTTTHEGGCRCGAVRYTVTGDALFRALCHCDDCRRSTGAPAVAWAMFDESQVAFSAAPAIHESSPGARRGFCARCGTSLSFTADYLPGLVDLTIGSFDDPAALPPQLHYWESRRVPWLVIGDGLPRHAGFPPMA